MNTPMNAIRTDELRFRTRELAARAERAAYLRPETPGTARSGLVRFVPRWTTVPARSLLVRATASR